MKKTVIFLGIMVLFALGIFMSKIILNNISDKSQEIELNEQAKEEIYDECTEEYDEKLNNNASVTETVSEEEKISPNCSIVFKRFYTDCEHILEQYTSIPTELINKTKEDLQNYYIDWKIEEFSRTQIVLYREFNSECGEHYMLREKDGMIVVYLQTGDVEELVEETDIGTEFLTETDKIKLQNGIKAVGRSELNQLIEDYE